MTFRAIAERIRYGRPIVVVSGLPRSGTSMLMKMLDAADVEIASDGQRASDADNPKGYFELERVKSLDKNGDKSWLAELRGRAVKIISYFLKELPADNRYKVIFLLRDLREVMASQNKMLARRGEPADPAGDETMIAKYEGHLDRVRAMLQQDPKFQVLYVNHRQVLDQPREEADRICRFLGVKGDRDKMAAVVDPDLYRNRS